MANRHRFGGAQRQCICIPLRGLSCAIIRSVNVYISHQFTVAGEGFHSLCSGFMHIRRFKNHTFMNAWPNRSVERTWNVEIAVSLGFRDCPDQGAIITRVLHKKSAPNLLQSTRGQLTMLDIISAALEHALSQTIPCVYIWSTKLLGHSIILLRNDDCAVAVASRCGVMLSATCLLLPGIFSSLRDYSTERIITHLRRNS